MNPPLLHGRPIETRLIVRPIVLVAGLLVGKQTTALAYLTQRPRNRTILPPKTLKLGASDPGDCSDEKDKPPGQAHSAIHQGIQAVGTTGLEPGTSTVSW